MPTVEFTLQHIVIGALTGMAYGVLGVGIVLIYRATRVVNFAHGEIGALGAAVLAKLVLDENWPYLPALFVALGVGAALAALVELTVVRRLFRSPRLVLLVATIGVAQLVFVLQLVFVRVRKASTYPSPIDRVIDLGGLLLRSEHFMVIAVVPAAVAGLAWFLMKTPAGLALRAAADEGDVAELAGISTRRVSTMAWMLAGAFAVLTAVLINPLRNVSVGIAVQALGPTLMLRALAAAMAGRLTSLPVTLLAGVGVGIAEAFLIVNTSPAYADLLLFAVVLVLVLTRGRGVSSDETAVVVPGSRAQAAPPTAVRRTAVRLRWAGLGVALLVAVAAPFVKSSAADTFLLSRVLLFAVIALSVTVLTGWAGQLSLAQVAFVGLGSMTTAGLVAHGVPFGVAVAYSVVAGAAAALLIGFPALRVPGLLLAVTTLAFAVMARSWLFTRPLFTGGRAAVTVPRGELFGIDLASERAYYFVCLGALVATAWLVAHLRRTGIGRAIIAVRDNSPVAASFSVRPAAVKLLAFALSGALAALAGGLLAGLRVHFGADAFEPDESLRVVAMTIIGGLGSVAGAVIGAVYVVGLPQILGGSQIAAVLTSGVGLLLLLLYQPGGLVAYLNRARQLLLARLAERATSRAEVPEIVRPVPTRLPDAVVPPPTRRDEAELALRASGITVSFGGRLALDDVSVQVGAQEVVGLIGTNGAGKSTLMNVISGFVKPVSGRVELFGTDVTDLPPATRATLGIGRAFQDGRLFNDLTVTEVVQTALEARQRSELVPAMLALAPARRAEKAKVAETADILLFLGLGRYADTPVAALSTGTRRIVELAALLAQRPQLLLLDEPAAGVAQRETEALVPLVKRVRAELGAGVLIIDHDMPFITALSDRLSCFVAGRCIAEGTPAAIRNDPEVVAAYLGTDARVIERSGKVRTRRRRPLPPAADVALAGGS